MVSIQEMAITVDSKDAIKKIKQLGEQFAQLGKTLEMTNRSLEMTKIALNALEMPQIKFEFEITEKKKKWYQFWK